MFAALLARRELRLPADFTLIGGNPYRGPHYNVDPEPEKPLESTYLSQLTHPNTGAFRSVAFPAISCSAHGNPHAEAVEISLAVCEENKWSKIDIAFYVFSLEMAETWRQSLARHR